VLKKVVITLGTGFGLSLLATVAFDRGPCSGVFLVFGGGITLLVACGILASGLINRRMREVDRLNRPPSP